MQMYMQANLSEPSMCMRTNLIKPGLRQTLAMPLGRDSKPCVVDLVPSRVTHTCAFKYG